jgi:hypothetical protein
VLALVALAAQALGACSSQDQGTLALVTGGETDTFTRTPAPTKLLVSAVDPSGKATTLYTGNLTAASTIDLGSQSESSVETLTVTGSDANGDRLVYGASLQLYMAGLAGLTMPVFVQRVGEMARLPGTLSDARRAPLLGEIQGQYLFVAGGSDPAKALTSQLYDFAQLAPLSAPPALPVVPVSAAFVGTVGWLLSASGAATYFDFAVNAQASIPPPAGGSFADVAGGATVIGDNGVEFIVGGTRTNGAPTATVLQIDPSGNGGGSYPYGGPTWITLTAPRLGAAAAWVTGRGLVVVGGSSTAAGAEVVAPGARNGSPLAYPPDDSQGGGAAALDNETVLVAGGLSPATLGDPGVRSIDLRCSESCAPSVWEPSLPVPILFAQAFALDPANALVVGSEIASRATHVFRITSASAKEIPTKVPHTDARAAWSPVGSIVLVGGSGQVESFVY